MAVEVSKSTTKNFRIQKAEGRKGAHWIRTSHTGPAAGGTEEKRWKRGSGGRAAGWKGSRSSSPSSGDMPTHPGTAPGYGPGTRPNPNAGKVCVRGFVGCGQTAGTYDPATQKQKGRKTHSKACQDAWRASGAAALQAQRSCPRMSPEEMKELKEKAAKLQKQQPHAASPTAEQPAGATSPADSPAAAAAPVNPKGTWAASGGGGATAPAAPTAALGAWATSGGGASAPTAAAAAAPAAAAAATTTAVGDPRLMQWAETEDNQSLVGLPIRLSFGGLGECCGKVTGAEGDMFSVVWTCGPKHDEEFKSKNISLEGVLGWHLLTHEPPPPPPEEDTEDRINRGLTSAEDWPEWDDHRTRGSNCPLLGAPAESKLVDFSLPMDGHEFFPGCDTDPGERWWATLARLNDPAAAAMYAPHIPSYPLPWLLTIILVTKEEMGDPSVKLPR